MSDTAMVLLMDNRHAKGDNMLNSMIALLTALAIVLFAGNAASQVNCSSLGGGIPTEYSGIGSAGSVASLRVQDGKVSSVSYYFPTYSGLEVKNVTLYLPSTDLRAFLDGDSMFGTVRPDQRLNKSPVIFLDKPGLTKIEAKQFSLLVPVFPFVRRIGQILDEIVGAKIEAGPVLVLKPVDQFIFYEMKGEFSDDCASIKVTMRHTDKMPTGELFYDVVAHVPENPEKHQEPPEELSFTMQRQ